LLVVLGLCVLPQSASAYDGVMAGAGANLVPQPNQSVAIHSAHVALTFVPDEQAWRVHASYELDNSAGAALSLQLGFPEYRCAWQGEDDDEDDCADPDAYRYQDMETLVRGQAVKQRRGRLSAKHAWAHALGAVWLHNVRLGAGERVPIEHRYVMPASSTAVGGMSATYVTRTGSLWAKPIERATFDFWIPVRSCLIVEPEGIGRRLRKVVLRGGEPWLQLSYGARSYRPETDLSLHFETCIPARDTELEGCSLQDQLARFAYPTGPDYDGDSGPIDRAEIKARLQELESDELKRCGELVFRAYATYFNEEELAVLAKRPAAARHYTGALLTPEDWQWVALVDEVIAARKLQKPAATPQQEPPEGCAGCTVGAAPSRTGVGPVVWLLMTAELLRRARSRRRKRP
jgi:hypothetical protein